LTKMEVFPLSERVRLMRTSSGVLLVNTISTTAAASSGSSCVFLAVAP
jgi:hypothetical protein